MKRKFLSFFSFLINITHYLFHLGSEIPIIKEHENESSFKSFYLKFVIKAVTKILKAFIKSWDKKRTWLINLMIIFLKAVVQRNKTTREEPRLNKNKNYLCILVFINTWNNKSSESKGEVSATSFMFLSTVASLPKHYISPWSTRTLIKQ